MDEPRPARGCVSPAVLIGAVLFALALFAALVVLLLATRETAVVQPGLTPAFTIIPAPTATPVPPTAGPTLEPSPTSQVEASPAPNTNIVVNAYVQIAGTGGDGLRVRAEPNLNGTLRFLALEAEVFQVRDGPREADGYTWWYLVAPYDESLNGWAASNFLQVVQQ